MSRWYGLVGQEVIGPFDALDPWYHTHAGPDWRAAQILDGKPDPWLVALTAFPDGKVSTVFLGLDHGLILQPGGQPTVFETMVFPECDVFGRACTWGGALYLHTAAVAALAGTS